MTKVGRIAAFTCIGVFAATTAFAGARIDASGGLAPATTSFAFENAEGVDESFGAETAGSYAVGAAWVFDDRIELGGQWQQSYFDDLSFSFSKFDESATLSSATVGGRYQFLDREHLFRPYLAGQVGVALADATIERRELFGTELTRATTEETGFGMNAGGGIDFQITRFLSVGADVRYNYAGVLNDAQYLTTMLNVGIHLG